MQIRVPHRHVYRVTILAAMSNENKALLEEVTRYAVATLSKAKEYALVKVSAESNDLFINPIGSEQKGKK